MILSIIVAVSENGVIGRANALPWHLPADLKHFKQLTTGHPIIMGRKTHESIGRPLPNRRNIVVTRQHDYSSEGCEITHSLDDALRLCRTEPEVFVIGGASIYREAMKTAGRIYLTKIHAQVPGDTYFPEIPKGTWKKISQEVRKPDEKNPYQLSFESYERAG